MALKFKLTKAEYDALTDSVKALYKLVGDEASLEVDGIETPAELKRAKDREVEEARKQRERAEKAEADLKEARDAVARDKGDVATLEKSWKDKLDAAVGTEKENAKQLRKQLNNALIDSRAMTIATELAGDAAELLLPTIKQRMQLELDGDNAIVRVLDKDGRKSALTVDELKNEVKADKRFAKIVIVSNASGGGAAGGQPNGGAGGAPGNKKFGEMNHQERTDWHKRDPEGFGKASETYQQEVAAARTRPAARFVPV